VDLPVPIIVGVIGGLVGVIPFLVARRRMKARMKKDALGGVITGVAATAISFLLMAAQIVFCYLVFRDYLLPFAISAIAVFILAMGVYTATLMRK